MFAFAMFMSSMYVVRFTCACGVGVSDVHTLNNVFDITPPCGTPVLNWRCVDVSEYSVCFVSFDVVCL